MIQFFKRIRLNLLMENKTGRPAARYLKYALGEILLVVIGILFALQVNNWNEERKDRVKEQILLKQLQEDYQSNLTQLESKMETREKILISAVRLLEAFDQPDGVVRDSIIKDLAYIHHDPTFDPIQNNLTGSGNLRLISDERLKRLLSNWPSDVVGVREIEVTWTNTVNGQNQVVLSELGLGRDISNSFSNDSEHLWLLDNNPNSYKIEIGTSKLGSDLNEILTSRKLESLVTRAITLNKAANVQSEALKIRIQEILNLISTEIK